MNARGHTPDNNNPRHNCRQATPAYPGELLPVRRADDARRIARQHPHSRPLAPVRRFLDFSRASAISQPGARILLQATFQQLNDAPRRHSRQQRPVRFLRRDRYDQIRHIFAGNA
jgi:hypothetical protein